MASANRDHYVRVLADLKLERDSLRRQLREIQEKDERLTTAISFIEERAAAAPEDHEATMSGEGGARRSDRFSGLSLVAATENYLNAVGQFSDTRTVCNSLLAGGFETKAKNFYQTAFGTLNREAKREDSRLVKREAKWGLREWLDEEQDESQTEVSGETDLDHAREDNDGRDDGSDLDDNAASIFD